MIRYLIRQLKYKVVSLRFSILFVFVSLFIAMTFLMISASSIRFFETLTITTRSLMRYASNNVLNALNAGIRPAVLESQFSAHLVQSQVVKDNAESLIPYTFNLLKSLPLALAVGWGDEHGDYYYAEKQGDKIRTEIYRRSVTPATHTVIYYDTQGKMLNRFESSDFSYDPRTRPWYIEARNKKRTIWSDVYLFSHSNKLGVTVGTPAYSKDGKFLGVFGVHVSLDYISSFMTRQTISPNGFSYIITAQENLIAYPNRKPFTDYTADTKKNN